MSGTGVKLKLKPDKFFMGTPSQNYGVLLAICHVITQCYCLPT